MKARHYLFIVLMLSAITTGFSQNYVQNGNFAETTTDLTTGVIIPTDWTLTGKATLDDGVWILNLQTKWLPDGAVEGDRAIDLWRETDEPYQLKLTQTITSLPDGIYSLSAVAALGGEDVFALYAKIGDDVMTIPMPESGNYEKKELNGIQVTGGSGIVGFTANSTSSANWFDITNFEFVKTGDLTSINKVSPKELSVITTGKSIRVTSGEPVLSASLISIDGKVSSAEKFAEKEISFSVPQSGIYILQVKQTSGVQVRKIAVRN
jgi:hypothetical protein